jgi:hypothetical protein
MYQEGEWLRVSCPTSVLDLIPLLMGCSKNKAGGCGSRGAPLGTFSIPNVGIASGEGSIPTMVQDLIESLDGLYQESAGVRVSIPTMVQDLIESLDGCTKKGEWLRVSCPTRVLDLIHSLDGCTKKGEWLRLSVPNECIGSYRIIGWMWGCGGFHVQRVYWILYRGWKIRDGPRRGG